MKTGLNRITALLLTVMMLFAVIAVPVNAADYPQMYYLVEDDSTSEYGLRGAHYEDADGNIVEFETAPAATLTRAAALPAKYSSVSAGIVTPVKDQGDASCCWAFSTLSVLETYAVKNGYSEVKDADYSEAHLAWFSGNSITDNTADPMYGDGRRTSNPYDSGTFWRYASFTLAKGSGVNKEKEYPFNNASLSTMGHYDESARYAHSVGYLSGCQLLTTNTERKTAVQQNGSITLSYYYDEKYENNEGEFIKENDEWVWHGYNCAYNYDGKNGSQKANHMVTVVGWDDSFPVTSFVEGHRPKAPGAWLCKNSWGTQKGWGVDGYFWLSYEDTSICDTVAWQMVPASTYDGIYQYDGFGWHGLINWGAAVEQANIYTARDKHDLTAIGFYTAQNNVNAVVRVYTGMTDEKIPTSGNLVVEQAYTAAYEGYHTVTLKKPLALVKNQKFAVVVETSAAQGDLLVPIEGEGVGAITCHSVSGTSFIRFANNGTRWFNSTDLGYGNNAIKAYYKGDADSLKITTKVNTLEKGKTLQLTAERTGGLSGQPVTWSAVPASVATVNANGLVTALAEGKVRITATCGTVSTGVQLTVTPKCYTVTWKIDGKTEKQENIPAGSAIPSYVPTKAGYTFNGWDKTVPAVMPENDLTFNGTFSPVLYKAKFVAGSEVTEFALKYGDPIPTPAAPHKSGYIFAGWTPRVPATMPASDMTFVADFKKPIVSISGYAATKNVDYNTSVSFSYDADRVPSGTEIHWFINGIDQGGSYSVQNVTGSFSVQAKLLLKGTSQVIAQSDTETVKVKTDFFSKLLAFFRKLFKATSSMSQKAEVKF